MTVVLVYGSRLGTALVEIVSAPELRSGAEAATFVRTLLTMLKAMKVSDGSLAGLNIKDYRYVRRSYICSFRSFPVMLCVLFDNIMAMFLSLFFHNHDFCSLRQSSS